MTPHEIVAGPELPPASGYSHGVVVSSGRVVYMAGQVAQRADGSIAGETLVEQYDLAARNLIAVLRAAGGGPEHLVSLQVFVTDVGEYRASRPALRQVWSSHFGNHYPAMALLGVRELFDPAAKVELMGIAVIP